MNTEMSFSEFLTLFQEHFSSMTDGELFIASLGEVGRRIFWDTYMAFWNKISYAKNDQNNKEMNSSNDKRFIEKYAGIISVKDGTIKTLWDFEPKDDKCRKLCQRMKEVTMLFALSQDGICTFLPFYTSVRQIGKGQSVVNKDGKEFVFDNFFLEIPEKFQAKNPGKKVRLFFAAKQVIQIFSTLSDDEISSIRVNSEYKLIVEQILESRKKVLDSKSSDIVIFEESAKLIRNKSFQKNKMRNLWLSVYYAFRSNETFKKAFEKYSVIQS